MVVALALTLSATACGSDDDPASDAVGSGQDPDGPSDAEDNPGDADADAGTDTDDGGESPAGDDDEPGSAAGDFPREVETAAGTVLIEVRPDSIVSLSPTATEMLFAIDAGAQVAAVDLYSDYPPEAPEGTLDGFVPDLEAILANRPDLVVASGLPEDVAAGLGDSGVAVMLLPAALSFDDTFDQIAQLGEATGRIDEAAALNAEIRAEIDDVLADLPETDTPVRVFHEIDDSFYTATSASFVGQVYETMGFANIADPLDDGTGFPLIDGESILAGDPSLIVFTSQAPYTADEIAARPGWSGVTAVARGNIVQVDADIASRWGPRIVEFMRAIADVVAVKP